MSTGNEGNIRLCHHIHMHVTSPARRKVNGDVKTTAPHCQQIQEKWSFP